ncbi:MAG: Dps family protein [Pseudomonadota bacterium]|nr:Dps family protein [Pseudomonadota bacterium]
MKELTNRQASTEALKHILADSYVLLVKIQNVHWNIEGHGFIAIHKLLDEQYEDVSEAIDVIAERIRALGEDAPASFKEFLALSRLEESDIIKGVDAGVKILADAHENLSTLLLEHIAVLDNDNDAGTIDLFTDRIRAHDQAAWLLRANLQS